VYLVVLYKKIQCASAFILTIIAVAVSAMKRRGGMGTNLAIGLHWLCLCLLKSLEMAEKSSIPPMLAFGLYCL
jgi:lipopolysaccharide export system permease protein